MAAVTTCRADEESCVPAMTDPLPSWRDTATRSAIVAFVESVTRTGGAGFVPPDWATVFDPAG